ncbi:Signal transduction histidine kinase [Klenkia soli]|uniref:histidine kinase n=2 Tax=Klenkia soli TaxID=1052260 RepID=A0A1H0J980_9ACTN|nr:Signal transduction histidine kinase [Klenkia soli]
MTGMTPRLRLVVPVVVLAVVSLGPLARLGGITPAAVAVSVLLAATALARHRAPLPALGAAAVLLAVWWVGHGLDPQRLLPAGAVLLWLLASVADRRPVREVVVATALVAALPVTLAVLGLLGRPGGEAVVPLTAVTVVAVVAGRNRRTRRSLLVALEERAVRAERERDAGARAAVAEERTRIAREVHDVVAHNISVMTALADGAGYALDADPERARGAMAQVAATGREAIAEMHRLLGVLRADGETDQDAPAPGLAQLDQLVEQVRAAGLAVTLTVRGAPAALPATAQLAVHRLVQEALTNTLTHADGARTARVSLQWRPDDLLVQVTDDGRGGRRDPERPPGHGLVGMRERFGAWGGTVETGPGDGGGWRVRAVLPLDAPVPA